MYSVSHPLTHSEKLKTLRAAMAVAGVDGFIVPRIDLYQGEFVAAHAERLAWLTGFTGSAGIAVVLKNKAAVLTDGRYTIQLSQQVDKTLYQLENSQKILPSAWIAREANEGSVIGYDPWLHTPKQIEAVEKALAEKSITLKPVDNLIDPLWKDRPKAPATAASVFPDKISGSSGLEKKSRMMRILKDNGAYATILNMPDSLCWLLNVRGDDIPSTPVVLSLGVLYADERPLQWFVDPKKIDRKVAAHIKGAAEIIAIDELEKRIDALAGEAKAAGLPIALDFARAPVWFKQRLETKGAALIDLKDPCIVPKSLKAASEQESIRDVHVRDGVAMVKFLAWFEEATLKGGLTEISASDRLEEFRREDPSYQGPSFDTISGFGPHGAIVHYRATNESDMAITSPGILLLDSGGQYHYGTTDITRTIAIGKPLEEVRRNFTLVLKGHIALARAEFSKNTTGTQLDALARQPLLDAGLDYSHGSGHGVGCYLSVHEEAASISTRGQEPPQPGMLISNEPGYYKEGAYGIRIENLVLTHNAGADQLKFETVTLVPIDRALIDAALLSAEERRWLNEYHARIFKTLSPRLDQKTNAWLGRATQAV